MVRYYKLICFLFYLKASEEVFFLHTVFDENYIRYFLHDFHIALNLSPIFSKMYWYETKK